MSTVSKAVRVCDYESHRKCARETVLRSCLRCGKDYCDRHLAELTIAGPYTRALSCCHTCAEDIERSFHPKQETA